MKSAFRIAIAIALLVAAVASWGETIALTIDPKMASSLYKSGLAERMNGDVAAADADMAAATKIDPAVDALFVKWGAQTAN